MSLSRRQVVDEVLQHRRPPYVPWSFGFTKEARDALEAHFGGVDLEDALGNHLLQLGQEIGFFTDIGDNRVQDVFGVVWDRSVDKDIGVVQGCVLARPTLAGYEFPDPLDDQYFRDIPSKIANYGDRFRVFQIGFSLYERAWTLRGLENLMMDLYDNPTFVKALLNSIADYNIAQLQKAMNYDIDAVYFGDDWGQQTGLQMGPQKWREFILPVLTRMYGAVKAEGKYVFIHSCGKVDELFDTLVGIGLDCFNPFQPEVMDVLSLMERHRSRLTFHGGLSTQQTLPYGTPDDVLRESETLLRAGQAGGYLFAPAHDVEGDVPLENILTFIAAAQGQIE